MLVYYLVIVSVLFLAAYAQKKDSSIPCTGNGLIHPPPLGYFPHSPEAFKLFFVMAAIPILVAGLRFQVGTDYGGYYLRWEDVYANRFWSSLISLDEPGFRFIAYITQRLGAKTGAMAMFLASLITIGLGYWTVYRNVQHLFLPSVLFLFLGNWIASFNAVRQCLAASIVFAGYPFLRDKKLWKYAAMVALAYLFHRSSILMIVPFFFLHRRVDWKSITLVMLGTIVLLNSYERLFRLTGIVLEEEIDLENLSTYSYSMVNRLRILTNVAPAAFFLYVHFSTGKKYMFSDFFLNILILNASISVAAMNSPLFSRYSLYIFPFMPLALSDMTEKTPMKIRKPIVVIMIFLYAFFVIYECNKSFALNHFQWIWNAV